LFNLNLIFFSLVFFLLRFSDVLAVGNYLLIKEEQVEEFKENYEKHDKLD